MVGLWRPPAPFLTARKTLGELFRPVLQPGRAPLSRPGLGRDRAGAVRPVLSDLTGPGYRARAGLARAPG